MATTSQADAADRSPDPDGPLERVADAAEAVVDAIKPRLRGWIHAGTFPVVVVASILLVVLAPPVAGKVSTAIFGFTAILLFGTSAVYHLGTWSPRVHAALRRADHSNIFLIIAGTCTPLAVLLLPKGSAITLLVTVWAGALLGLAARMIWIGAPRWVYVPVYIALGWVAVFYMPEFASNGSPAIVWLVAVGGLAYSVGALVYGLKRPNPSPQWFGFHEIFHVLTVVGYGCHYAAILVAVFIVR